MTFYPTEKYNLSLDSSLKECEDGPYHKIIKIIHVITLLRNKINFKTTGMNLNNDHVVKRSKLCICVWAQDYNRTIGTE